MGIISLLNGGCFNILKNPKADPKTEFHNFPNFPLANQTYNLSFKCTKNIHGTVV